MRVLEGCVQVARVSLSDWLALRARIRGFAPPAIARPSYGWGCIGGQFMLGQAIAVFDSFV